MPNTAKLSKYLKPEHCKDGDIINFMNAGIIEDRTFSKDGKDETKPILELMVEIKGEAKLYSPNGTTISLLNEAWGYDTEGWVGKQGRVYVVPTNRGKNMILCKPIV